MIRISISQLGALLAVASIVACADRTASNEKSDSLLQAASIAEVGDAVALRDSSGVFVAEPVAVAVSERFIYVADGGAGRVLQYDRAGRLVRQVGRKGRGPGEITAISAVVAMGDTAVVVADAGSRRLIVYDANTGQYRFSRQLRSNPFTVSIDGNRVLAATFDAMQTTSMYLASLSGDSGRVAGPVSPDYANSRHIKFSYPFSVASLVDGGAVVGLVASPWLYRTDIDGVTVDSVRLATMHRRGVPDDLDQQLAENKSPGAEMLMTSVLMALGAHGNTTYQLHADFRPEGPDAAVSAFVSALNWRNHRQCVDAAVPVASSTRPVFAFRADTLVVAQNVMQAGDSAAVVTVRLFKVAGC